MRQYEANERAVDQLKRTHQAELQQEQQQQQRLREQLADQRREHTDTAALLQHEKGKIEQLHEQIEDLQQQLARSHATQLALKVTLQQCNAISACCHCAT